MFTVSVALLPAQMVGPAASGMVGTGVTFTATGRLYDCPPG